MSKSNEELVQTYKNAIINDDKQKANDTFCSILAKNKAMIRNHINRIINTNPNKKSLTDDMYQMALIALMHAVRTFDPNLSSFHTYAYDKVKFAIYDFLADDHFIRIPRHKQKYISLFYEIVNNYKNEHNDTIPPDEYIIHMLDVTERQYKDIKAAISAYCIDSLDSYPLVEDECIIAPNSDPLKIIINRDANKQLSDLISNLKNKKESNVINDYFYENNNLSAIAQKNNVTLQRICNLKNNGIKHLAQIPEINEIADEL